MTMTMVATSLVTGILQLSMNISTQQFKHDTNYFQIQRENQLIGSISANFCTNRLVECALTFTAQF